MRRIAGQLQARGKLHLDAGAADVLKGQGKSLLPVGVKRVEGVFDIGDLVICLDPEGREIARGLSNYSAGEATKILGAKRDELMTRLGYPGEAELIHRDNLVLS